MTTTTLRTKATTMKTTSASNQREFRLGSRPQFPNLKPDSVRKARKHNNNSNNNDNKILHEKITAIYFQLFPNKFNGCLLFLFPFFFFFFGGCFKNLSDPFLGRKGEGITTTRKKKKRSRRGRRRKVGTIYKV